MTTAELQATLPPTEPVVSRSADDYTLEPDTGVITYRITPQPGLQLRWQRAGDAYTVCEHRTGIFGHGPDLPAALDDLRQALAEHCDVLERQDALSDELAAQLEYL